MAGYKLHTPAKHVNCFQKHQVSLEFYKDVAAKFTLSAYHKVCIHIDLRVRMPVIPRPVRSIFPEMGRPNSRSTQRKLIFDQLEIERNNICALFGAPFLAGKAV